MRFILLHVPFLRVNAMALYPFILLREKKSAHNAVLINHEKIHLRQERELLILPFYFLYLGHYIMNRSRRMKHDAAYRHIIFEREAYAHENNPGYLKTRSLWQWRKD